MALVLISPQIYAKDDDAAKGIAPVMVPIPGKNYEIGKYEVTQGEWRAVMGNNPSHFKSCGSSCPVEQVNWDDIKVFIRKLNARTGKQYRLPTEAEWEYACQGGSKSKYCGSNTLAGVAWYGNDGKPGGNSRQTTHAAGKKQANGYDLYDMSGNVWEWTNGCWEGDCNERVLRGGSWGSGPDASQASNRIKYGTVNRGFSAGFRLVRTLP